jgi:hypothetical protein
MLSFAFVSSIAAQSNRAIERELVGHIKDIERYSAYGLNDDLARRERANRLLKNKLLRYGRNASTLKYDFPELSRLMKIVTSDDRRLRVYSWPTYGGGTMSDVESLYQFQGADGTVRTSYSSLGLGDAGQGIEEIANFDSKHGRIYIVMTSARVSNTMEWQHVSLFRIVGGRFQKARFFKTGSGLTNKIAFSYDNRSFTNNQFNQVIKFDRRRRTITFPVVVEGDPEFSNGKITNQLITYRFNGTHFVKV